jgi:catechol 2,3-dioxygenase-like lactoylglutathione lyase family enzyme
VSAGHHERMVDHPILRQTVFDAVDARALAEFYRRLLGLRYRIGDEVPDDGGPDPQAAQWLALRDDRGAAVLAFQPVPALPEVTWPDGDQPQRMHLDLTVPTIEDLERQHARALELGARLVLDESDDPEEPLYVYTDPSGHPFCIFVAPGGPDDGH